MSSVSKNLKARSEPIRESVVKIEVRCHSHIVNIRGYIFKEKNKYTYSVSMTKHGKNTTEHKETPD
ncbi:hypothetical protein E2C01_078481 [Portunus trituberculatus]|uniref:Uncharacterized protein n=1 Tax=Portunus trituberculatus TaxID=210409 RepID=A0A5B7IN01_PORTR|nr:hypothetical protein [Portunus trituberculatus]